MGGEVGWNPALTDGKKKEDKQSDTVDKQAGWLTGDGWQADVQLSSSSLTLAGNSDMWVNPRMSECDHL